MMHGAPSSLSYSLHSTQHSYTTYTSDTTDQQHKNKQLKASNAKTGSHKFPEFWLQKFRNFGTWVTTEFPEIGISGIAITSHGRAYLCMKSRRGPALSLQPGLSPVAHTKNSARY
jgi:hypothetical protein